MTGPVAGTVRPKTTNPAHGRVGARILLATSRRVLGQLRHDHRTIGMLVAVPLLLITLLYFMFSGERATFDHVALVMVGIFPFTIMFLITSIAMLRERTSGTLERLMTTPARPVDLLGGYALAFGAAAAGQSLIVVGATYWLFGVHTAAGAGVVVGIAVLTALLGVGLGLLCSAFARTEFQAVQMLPVVVIPQILLCGLFIPRDSMKGWLTGISDVLPLSYAVDAMQQAGTYAEMTGRLWRDLVVIAACVILALGLAAATMRRQTK